MIATWPVALGLLLAFLGVVSAETFPPKGFHTLENSTSPDGRYAVIVSANGTVDFDQEKASDLLYDIHTNKEVCEIESANYADGANRRTLAILWAPDSSWCVSIASYRFGFDSVAVLKKEQARWSETEIGRYLDEQLQAKIAQRNRGAKDYAFTMPHLRCAADGKLRVRAAARTNPKQFANEPTYAVLFQGTYEVARKVWKVTDTRGITPEESLLLDEAYEGVDASDQKFKNVDERELWLDGKLNLLYRALKVVLPEKQFSSIKQEQLQWLKARKATASAAERCKALFQRCAALDVYLW